MISNAVFEAFKGFVPEENIHLQEPMSAHTTFKVGGPADCLIELESMEQFCRIQHYLKQLELPFTVMGNGSNTLVSDRGYRGVILQIGRRMSGIRTEGNCIVAQAGAQLIQVARTAWEHGLTGIEFAFGIPGTVGGGVVMNAGAYGGEMSRIVKQVTVISDSGEMLQLDNESMEFGYRKSTIRNQPFSVMEVVFELEPGDRDAIRERMEELSAKRKQKQPLEFPSAGSTFKRPEGYYAGELIMKAGMRGFQIGGARVSDKHCGFVVNTGNATAEDILEVIHEVQERVKDRFHVELEPEVVFLGFANRR